MQCRNGFSLIETLVAIILASIATLALLQVVSTSSRSSNTIISNFDEFQMMGLGIGLLDADSETTVLTLDETVQSRYKIDHSDIIASLQPFSYTLSPSYKETIDPFITSNLTGMAQRPAPLILQKITITNSKEEKSFFRLTSGSL